MMGDENNTLAQAHAALLQGDYALSEELYREVLREEPSSVCALDGLAILFCQNGDVEPGITLFEQALYLLRKGTQPNRQWEGTILFHLGLAYKAFGQPLEALKVFHEGVKLNPTHADLVLNLGQLHFELEQYPQAAGYFRTLTALQPDDPSAWLTLGFILSNLEQYEEAAEVLRTAATLDSASPEVCFYLAESLRKAERFEESIPYYQRMLPVGTEYPQAVFGYGKSLLALGHLEQGWEAMEFRFASEFGTWERHRLPNWSPDSDASCVLAYSEEGIGADLMFASCLPELINSVEHCVVECEPSLHSLFRRSFPRAEFVPLADDYVSPEGNPWGGNGGSNGGIRLDTRLDAQIAFGSLPRYFRRQKDDFPLRKAYLAPDRDLRDRWHTQLAGLGDAKKIGILWNGTWTHETAKQTALPHTHLRNFMTRFHEAAWVNLQHGSHQKAMNEQNPGGRRSPLVAPHLFPEAFQYDLDAMAALLVNLDLVITPPGYVAHLAGALGVRTWLLVPECADWRHTIDTAAAPRSVWHPTIKMYRQAKGQLWQHFFATLGDDLEKFLTTDRPPEEMPAILTLPTRKTLSIPKAA